VGECEGFANHLLSDGLDKKKKKIIPPHSQLLNKKKKNSKSDYFKNNQLDETT
jgi:hypothetical protein